MEAATVVRSFRFVLQAAFLRVAEIIRIDQGAPRLRRRRKGEHRPERHAERHNQSGLEHCLHAAPLSKREALRHKPWRLRSPMWSLRRSSAAKTDLAIAFRRRS